MKKQTEIARLREQTKEQRALLRRAQRWIGVAAGAIVSGAPRLDHAAHVLHQEAHEALALGGEISAHLAKHD